MDPSVVPQNNAPFPSFRARSTSSSTLNPNTPTPANHTGGGIASPAWLNALSDGLSWIETSKAAQKAAEGAVGIAGIGMGVGESIRDGLSARLSAAGDGSGNGLVRRPLSFTGWGGQFPGAGGGAGGGGGGGGSTARSSIDESSQQHGSSGFSAVDLTGEASMSNGYGEAQDSQQPQILRHRPASFLEYIRPSPPTPSPKRDSISKPGRQVESNEQQPHETRNNTPSVTLLKTPLATSVSSPPPLSDTGIARTSSQRRRLGPPQPANMTRLGSPQSAESDRSNPTAVTSTGHRFLRGTTAHKPSFSGSSVPPPATGGAGGGGGIASLPRSASSSTYSLHEQTKQTNDGAGLARSPSFGFNHARPSSVHTVSSGTSTPVMSRPSTQQQQPQRSRSHSLMQVQTMQRSQSGSSQLAPVSGQTPYRPGFQPAGVRTYRTEEFVEARKRKIMEISKEEGRLARRWGKVS